MAGDVKIIKIKLMLKNLRTNFSVTKYKKKIFGGVLMAVGLAILLTPFTPGSILLPVGANMFFHDWPEWQKLKEKIKGKFFKK